MFIRSGIRLRVRLCAVALCFGMGHGMLQADTQPSNCPAGTRTLRGSCVDAGPQTGTVGAALTACRARGLALLDEHTALALRAGPEQEKLPSEFWVVSAGKVYRFDSRAGRATLYTATTPEVSLPYYCMSSPESRSTPPDAEEGCTDSDANACSSILHLLACLFWSSRK